MPIDPRIALGVQPVQMPDFMGYANQAANILQSRASEQNALALMAQRQRQEQEAMNVTNALRGFDPTNPAAVSRLYQMPGGAAEAESIFKAQEAQEKAKVAGMESTSARNAQSMRTIVSFDNPLQAWASISAEEKKGLDPARAAAARQALKQAIAQGPTGFRDWQVATMRKLLTPEQQLEQETREVSTGPTTQIMSRPKFGGGEFSVVNEVSRGMTPEEASRVRLAQEAEARQQRESDQRMYLAQKNLTSIPGNPGWGYTADGKAIKVPFKAGETEAKEVTRNPETGAYAYTLGDLDGKSFIEVENADNARRMLITVLGYGTQEFNNTVRALKTAPSGLLNSVGGQASSAVNLTSEQRQALAELETVSQALVLNALNFKLGGQVSDADRQAFAAYVGDITNPNKTVGERLAAFEKFVGLQKRIGYMPKDGYNPFTGTGLPGQTPGGQPRTLSGQATPVVPVAPRTGQGTVLRPQYTPEEEADIKKRYGL